MNAKVVLIVILLVPCFQAWVATEPFNRSSGQTSHCLSRDVGPLDKGEERNIPNKCSKAVCLASRDVSIIGCGVVKMDPPCYGRTDYGRTFPDCCPENNIVC